MRRPARRALPLAAFAAALAVAAPTSAWAEPLPALNDTEPLDFTAEALALSSVVACDGRPFDTARFDAALVAELCKALDAIFDRYQREWLAKARPFFAALVPADLPKTVVYPFGGADLLTALVVYPDLREITSFSLEAGGDPRAFATLDKGRLARSLALHRRFLDKLVTVNHSRTLDLGQLKGDPLPSQVVFALVGLEVHGYEPVRLRYFRLEPDGSLRYLTARDVTLGEQALSGASGSMAYRKRAELFGNVELVFRKVGGGPEQVYRHVSANLDDTHLGEDGRALAHLASKGKVAAMTKAASYLLWWHNFDTVRAQLLSQMVWMVSDSTGVPPNLLDLSVFEIETYGQFRHTAIKGSAAGEAAYRQAWEEQPQRELPFMFGYPARAQTAHLVVTRRKK